MISTLEKAGSFPIHLWSIRDMDRALDEICKKYPPRSSEEEERLLDLCPYFATVWPSARALAAFISDRKSSFIKKRGIEVGCGLGLPSILAAKIGASITASDFHPDVDHWLSKNAELNQVKLAYHHWDWTSGEAPRSFPEGGFDFVLASDVLYEKRHPEDLVKGLAGLVKPGGFIYLSDPGRAYLERAIDAFRESGFGVQEFQYEVEESSAIPEHRLEKKRAIRVFELIRE